ncbi:MAG: peptidase M3 [Crocinitomicaceae bacterium]|nr:peptidase M3 [Crocinitomicaceae bacterium]|tara:strand:- start:126 stop:2153 length:2028 start_codon:yes stop_codon:yes gene_type:complete
MNPFTAEFNTPFETVPFEKIKPEHFLPALDLLIDKNRKEIDQICNQKKPNFFNVIEALEQAGRNLGKLSSTFFNLNSAETNDEIQEIAKTFSPKLSAFGNEITMNETLFEKVKHVVDTVDKSKLSTEQITLLDKTYKRFVRNGALASEDIKDQVKTIDEQLSKLKLQFGENVLKETNAFELVIEDEKNLKGLPDSVIQAASELAQETNRSDCWVFNLQYPSYLPFMTYAENGELRQKMFRAFASRGFTNNENNNEPIVIEIANLRLKRAQLLGYKTHADFVLEERMASTPQNVEFFLNDLLEKSIEKAKEQVNEVAIFASDHGAKLPLQRWDFSYWSEKLKLEKYNFNDEILKPYFQLENVINGVFLVANKLYGLTFIKNNRIQIYNADVQTYEVYDMNNNFISVFYADFHPRKGKRPGAWMTSYQGQFVENGKETRPHISIVCNFSKATSSEPSLLTFMEVKTLFHEFGHALHGMLAKGKYESLSGTNVFWDFVELPSQLMENWCYEKECLDLYAKHYETGELIPNELISKLIESAKYLEAYYTIRQLSFGLLDMAWNGTSKEITESVAELEQRAMERTSLFPPMEGISSSTAFAHIFSGGYSSGYYSYKWAEVLDADAFEAFKEKGIFNLEVASAFRSNILEKGGSEHPMNLYKAFRGKEPSNKALLKRAGLD